MLALRTGMAFPAAKFMGGSGKRARASCLEYPWLPLACAAFAPVRVEEPEAAAPLLPAPRTALAARRRTSVVEIALGNGRSLKVDEDIDPAVLAGLAGALDRGKR